MPVLALIFLPAAWCGWLVATVAVWALSLTLPLWGVFVPAQIGGASGGAYMALVGAGVAVIGNLLLLVDFDRWKPRWWIDNALVLVGVAAWLAGGLLADLITGSAWWRPLDGRLIAAILLAPQVAALLSGIKAADDSGLTTFFKLLAVVGGLAVLQAAVLWLLPA